MRMVIELDNDEFIQAITDYMLKNKNIDIKSYEYNVDGITCECPVSVDRINIELRDND